MKYNCILLSQVKHNKSLRSFKDYNSHNIIPVVHVFNSICGGCVALFSKLEENSTHKSAKTNAGNVFVTHNLNL